MDGVVTAVVTITVVTVVLLGACWALGGVRSKVVYWGGCPSDTSLALVARLTQFIHWNAHPKPLHPLGLTGKVPMLSDANRDQVTLLK